MSDIQLRLLGAPAIVIRGKCLDVRGKPVALLAYLARQPGYRCGREKAISVFWPDDPPERARHNLRQTLWYLRRVPGRLVTASRSSVALETGALCIDVDEFLAGIVEVENPVQASRLRASLSLYSEDFLDGLDLAGATTFEEWLLFEREHLRSCYYRGAFSLAKWDLEAGSPAHSIPIMERLARMEPVDEAVARMLITLHTASGQQAAAIRCYRTLTRVLDRELGADPAPETRVLIADVRAGRLQGGASSGWQPQPDISQPAAKPARSYFAALRCGLSPTGSDFSYERSAGLTGEYRYITEALAGQYGAVHVEPKARAHLILFSEVDTAVQFGLKLLELWARTVRSAVRLPQPLIRIGCHFGECTPLGNGEAYIGRAAEIARRLEELAEAGSLVITDGALDLLTPGLYRYVPAGQMPALSGHAGLRALYRITGVDGSTMDRAVTAATSAEAWLRHGLALIGTAEENSPAEEHAYREALRLNPSYAEAHNNLAVLLRQRGKDDEASIHYRRALQLRPDYAEAHYNYAILLEARGSLAGAAQHYRQSLVSRPEYVDAHLRYATLLRKRGRLTDAERRYRRVLQLRPNYAEAHNNYAILLDIKGDTTAAHHYQAALTLRPQYPEAHYNFALLLESRGDLSGAEAHYRSALKAVPCYVEALNNLAILLSRHGDFAGALSHCEEALRLRPNDPEIHYNYACLLNVLGDKARSELHLQTARELSPTSRSLASILDQPGGDTAETPTQVHH